MKDVAKYLEHAAECDRLAETALTEDQKQAILQIAKMWRTLAADREHALAVRSKAIRQASRDRDHD
jgi:hypothetical protein